MVPQDSLRLRDLLLERRHVVQAFNVRQDLQMTNVVQMLRISFPSSLLFYRRIFPTRKFRYLLLAFGIFAVCSLVATCFTIIFECTPIKKLWNPTMPGHCVNVTAFFVASGSINVVLDVYAHFFTHPKPTLTSQIDLSGSCPSLSCGACAPRAPKKSSLPPSSYVAASSASSPSSVSPSSPA